MYQPSLALKSTYDEPLIVDIFAGGGGASLGVARALGREPDYAINHDRIAIGVHAANHPRTIHLHSDVWEVCPREVAGGRPVGLLWASPDCRHHSAAKGGRPTSKRVRSLSWVVLRWAGTVRPQVICLENVPEIASWGPLTARRAANGRVQRMDGSTAAPGEVTPIADQHLQADKRRRGITWRRFVRALRDLGYTVEWRVRRACDAGAPTIRTRLYMVARCDGRPIVDIGMRMLTPRERARAQGFADAYILDRTIDGQPVSLTDQGRLIGNSVCPAEAEAIVAANCAHLARGRAVAAAE